MRGPEAHSEEEKAERVSPIERNENARGLTSFSKWELGPKFELSILRASFWVKKGWIGSA